MENNTLQRGNYQATELAKRPLPSIDDLYAEKDVLAQHNQLNILLNMPPRKEWILEHPFIRKEVRGEGGAKLTVPYTYLPVERIEYLMTSIFVKWRVEVLDSKLLANSIVITVRLHYLDPITGEWDYQDGIGASPLQIEKNSGAIEFNNMKSAAVQMAAPAAESYAFKDAAEKLGKLFGKDLNRKDEIGYSTLSSKFQEADGFTKNISEKLTNCSTLDELGLLWESLTEIEQGDTNIKSMFTARKLQFRPKQ